MDGEDKAEIKAVEGHFRWGRKRGRERERRLWERLKKGTKKLPYAFAHGSIFIKGKNYWAITSRLYCKGVSSAYTVRAATT